MIIHAGDEYDITLFITWYLVTPCPQHDIMYSLRELFMLHKSE